MDAVKTISTVATQLTAHEKKGMFVAIATPISAAVFALIGYAHAKANAKAISLPAELNIKWLNSQIKLLEQKVRFNTASVQHTQSKKNSTNRDNEVHTMFSQSVDDEDREFGTDDMFKRSPPPSVDDEDREFGTDDMFKLSPPPYCQDIKNHIIKLAFVGAILPAAILALYEKGADTLATETLQVISNLGAKALRNRGTSICLIVLLIAAKHFHNKAEKHHNTYLEELSKTGKYFLRYIQDSGSVRSRASSERYGLISQSNYNYEEYSSERQPRKTSWLSTITNMFSRKSSLE